MFSEKGCDEMKRIRPLIGVLLVLVVIGSIAGTATAVKI